MDLSNYKIIDNMLIKYEKLGYSKGQIKELRRGIESNLDISKYDNITFSSEEMFEKRWKLMKQKYS